MTTYSFARWCAFSLGLLLVGSVALASGSGSWAAAGVGVGKAPATGNVNHSSATKRPVLVELFTSEGCSSCPPADALLARLDASQPVGDVQVIVLSEHVTYWNQLGWHDPFSMDQMTERQQKYGSQFGLDSVYTPQAVVDGRAQMVGSDERRLIEAVTQAAALPKSEVTIRGARWSSNSVGFALEGSVAPGSTVTVVLARDGAQSAVLRGENGGRTLKHVAVVEVLREMNAKVFDGRAIMVPVPAADLSQDGALRLVVFVTEKKTGHVVGVAEQMVQR